MKCTLAALVIWAFASATAAHSPLEDTSPGHGDRLGSTPSELALTFKRDIRLTRVTWTYEETQTGQMTLDGQKSFASRFKLPLQDMGKGTYLIEWRGLGDDGHAQKGTISFIVD
ncbi:copper resistance CopC family protein [uncultured Tateyamaria sp.]|uniref:copper resistance CopC family protein n=1 Tax=uncultured Tateyamaria sp. TaxID=455651 RepID=UPI002633F48A|nr:copper resistance CopC family protein [uncultured Tateyamaria sp.]